MESQDSDPTKTRAALGAGLTCIYFFNVAGGGRTFQVDSWLGRNKPLSPESVSYYLLFPHGSVSKESAYMWETQARSLGREDSLQEGHGNPLQYSCLENSLDRGAWWVTVHGGRKESDMTKQLTHTHTLSPMAKQDLWSQFSCNLSTLPTTKSLSTQVTSVL